MDENQTNQNLNQQPVQPQPEQVQQPVQGQPEPQQSVSEQQQVQQGQAVQQQQPVEGQQPQPAQPTQEPTVSMQIQQLLVQQQQYQQQYNQLVDYVKKTPNLPIEQITQIKLQLDQLNALFVEGKQKLQTLGYSSVQVNKPKEVKKGAKDDFSFKKLVIGCIVVLLLILAGFFVTLTSLIKNPNALMGIGIDALTASTILKAFTGLVFGSIILLMVGVIIGNLYRIITVKNQSKVRNVISLASGVIGLIVAGTLMGLVWMWIGKIVTTKPVVSLPIIQPYLVGKVENRGEDEFNFPYDAYGNNGEPYPLIAPSEFAFKVRSSELLKFKNKNLGTNTSIQSLVLVCGNGNGNQASQRLWLLGDIGQINNQPTVKFDGRCLYGQKGSYYYQLEIYYNNDISKEKNLKWTINFSNPITFGSEILVYSTTSKTSSSSTKTSRVLPTNGEFNLGKAPSRTTFDTTQVFLDYKLWDYNIVGDLNGDSIIDRENQITFNYSYLIPQVYYPTIKFPDLKYGFTYAFPVRILPSDIPVCYIKLTHYQGTRTYNILSNFTDPSDATKISSYNYTIKDLSKKKALQTLRGSTQELNYTFPETGTYSVILDYVTTDGKQGRCESDIVQMKKETFDVQYALLTRGSENEKFKELCNSKNTTFSGCTKVDLDVVPKEYQLQIKSVTPYSNTLRTIVTLNDTALLNENSTYTFKIPEEGAYDLVISVSDEGRGMPVEYKNIRFTAKKADIVGKMTVTSSEKDPAARVTVKEGFEPLTVIIDASKTEVNVAGDEIIYFTWDFGDGEIKQNQQNAVVAHTYHYDYEKENGIFTPKVKIRTRNGIEKLIVGPTINVKKGLLTVDISSVSHPSRQAQVGKEVTFSAEFDGLPENMIWDFGDGSDPITCKGRTCTEITHTFEKTGLFSIKLSLEFDAVQQVDGTMDFKVYE